MTKILIAILVLIVFAGGGLWLIGPEKLWRQFGTIQPLDIYSWVGRSTPNWALACPAQDSDERYCKGIAPTHESPLVSQTPEDVFNWLVARIETAAKTQRHKTKRDTALKTRFIALSPGLSFPDIIDLEVFATNDGRAGFALLSQSQIGISDMNVNGQRIGAIIDDFKDKFVVSE